MYSWGSRYQWVPLGLVLGFVAPLPFYILHKIFPKMYFNKIHVPIVAWHVGWLGKPFLSLRVSLITYRIELTLAACSSAVTGINSAIISFFLVAFWSQWYLRRWKPDWFLRFNYVLCAGLDGGTQVIIFILTFALFGASGKSVPFPNYWGNNANGNLDYCKVDPANG